MIAMTAPHVVVIRLGYVGLHSGRDVRTSQDHPVRSIARRSISCARITITGARKCWVTVTIHAPLAADTDARHERSIVNAEAL
jgi:hypothetical protein